MPTPGDSSAQRPHSIPPTKRQARAPSCRPRGGRAALSCGFRAAVWRKVPIMKTIETVTGYAVRVLQAGAVFLQAVTAVLMAIAAILGALALLIRAVAVLVGVSIDALSG